MTHHTEPHANRSARSRVHSEMRNRNTHARARAHTHTHTRTRRTRTTTRSSASRGWGTARTRPHAGRARRRPPPRASPPSRWTLLPRAAAEPSARAFPHRRRCGYAFPHRHSTVSPPRACRSPAAPRRSCRRYGNAFPHRCRCAGPPTRASGRCPRTRRSGPPPRCPHGRSRAARRRLHIRICICPHTRMHIDIPPPLSLTSVSQPPPTRLPAALASSSQPWGPHALSPPMR